MSDTVPFSILHIEDNALEAALIEEMLLEAMQNKNRFSPNYLLKQAANMKAAEKALTKIDFDVILLDLHLRYSYGDAYFNIRRLQQLSPTSPIVILSSDDSQQSETLAKEAGACAYLIKGYLTGRSLLSCVQNISSENFKQHYYSTSIRIA